jgi:hypothetical protein
MNTTSGGSFATLLMTVPLAAIPLMAVFGVPQFTSVNASTDQSSEDIRRHPPSAFVSQEGEFDDHGSASPGGEGSGFVFAAAPQVRSPNIAAPRPLTRPSIIQSFPAVPTPDLQQRLATASAGPRPTALATSAADQFNGGDVLAYESPRAPRPQVHTVHPAAAAERVQGFTWQQAAQRLQQWGIEDYRLERGHETGTFLFVCQFATGGDLRIVRRFEAEHTEPLRAVQQVFARIDEWRQFAQSTATVPH